MPQPPRSKPGLCQFAVLRGLRAFNSAGRAHANGIIAPSPSPWRSTL